MATGEKKPAKKKNPIPNSGKKKREELSEKELLFCKEYLLDFNGSRAARVAGYSQNNSATSAYVLLEKPMIKAYLKDKIEQRKAEKELNAKNILREVNRLATFDARQLYDEKGRPRELHELDDDTAACIQGVEIVETYEGFGQDRQFVGYTKKYKVADKNSALQKAMMHLGLISNRVELTGANGGPVKVVNMTDDQLLGIINGPGEDK